MTWHIIGILAFVVMFDDDNMLRKACEAKKFADV